jgi:hypothetical protein
MGGRPFVTGKGINTGAADQSPLARRCPARSARPACAASLHASAGLSRVRGTYTGTSKEFIMTEPGHALLR